MKRFFSELGVLMRRRRHLLFLIILWSICALTTFVFCKGLDSTVKASFGKNENNEKKEYTYDLEVSNLDNLDKLSFRRTLNKVLTSSKVFDYYSYYVTSGTVVGLNKPESFDISTKTTTSKDEKGAFHTNYEVRVIFLDRNAAARVPNTAVAAKLVKMFDGDKDYNDILPVCFDYAWSVTESSSLYGNPEEGYPLSRVKTIDEDYSIDFKLSVSDFFNKPSEPMD
ncbi:MAG: hypothetical protein IKR27_00500, partial [Lachnospiraceae bacterium]|nr:hypothetical protein [Lachnospiraceae bacterium]